VVYVGTDEGSVHAFDYDSPERPWSLDTGSSVRSLVPGNDRLVVGTYDGYHVLGDSDSAGGGRAYAEQPAGGDSDRVGDDASSGGSGSGGSGTDTRQRGLFSNGGDAPDGISNPFNMTVLGFVLSIAGIVYQMIGGR
jgi:outer membrane protein assembly factor BamB